MRLTAELPTGVAALLFEEARRRREMEGRMSSELSAAGYSEVILPILDYLEPYERFLTEASRAELYRFVDRDGELLALRADFTPMLARLLAPRLGSLALPLRLFYRGDVVRYQEERAGRPREFYQVGAELIGVDGPAAGLEVLRRFCALLTLGQARPLRVVLGFAGALDEALRAAAPAVAPAVAARAVARRDRSAAGALPPVLRRVMEAGEPDEPGELGPAAAGRLVQLAEIRDTLAAEFPEVALAIDLAEFAHQALDPEILAAAGGRAYYDGILFRGYAGARGLPVGAGGRYDRLFAALGVAVGAVGFSLDLERLVDGRGTRAALGAGAREAAVAGGRR